MHRAVLAGLRCCVAGGAGFVAAPSRRTTSRIDVTVQTFVKPEGTRLRVLVRMPLKSITDVEYPAQGARFRRPGAGRSIPARRRASRAARTTSTSTKATRCCPLRASCRRACRWIRTSPLLSYDAALAHVTGPPLPDSETLYWEQGLLDVLFEYPIQSDRSDFSIACRASTGWRSMKSPRSQFLPAGRTVARL